MKTIIDKMWQTSYFKIDKENINRCDCPMNNPKMRDKLLKLYEDKTQFPVDYNENIFSAE